MALSHSVVIRRRRAVKDWTCTNESVSHDRHIRPGAVYCEVTTFDNAPHTRDVAIARLCNACGREAHERYRELCADQIIDGQMELFPE